MATIIQKPDTLSLSRNLKELIISTSSEISLQLLKGDSMLLEETYLPDVNNRVHVDLADIVTSTLSLTMPSGDAVSTSQGSIYSDFTVKVDGTSVAEFTAVRSGVERFSDTAANFLTANWLTWQPQVKEVLQDQPEWLTYYPASGFCACYARFYYTDGTSGEIKVCDVSQCVSINTRFSKLWALDESGKERYGVIDVYIKDAQGLRLTYVQRYVLCSQGALDEVYLCENSLGGLDTFRFYGDRKLVPEIGYTSLLLDNSYTAADPDLSRKWSQNTGMLTGRECEWCWELFRSSAAYHLYRGTILPIVLDASSVEKSAMSVLAAYSFDYRYASDLGLLNVVRSENLPEVVEISGPDAEVFFLKPRLNEYPSAVLSDDLIIPVQSPYEESWYTLSVGGLKSALLSSVETIYGPMWHEHDNLQVLNGLSVDSSGNLLYNGVQVGSGIVGAHDHHGETIRPEKIIVGDVEITCVDGRLHISKGLVSDGDIAAFGAEEGEEGGSGGLDIARLWEELEAEDSSKVIDVSHIPGSVVLQDELVEILDDYPLTTEMNEALSGKAALQHTHAISEVSGLLTALDSKWEWNATQVAGVKVSNAFAADKLASSVRINGTPFNGESDIVTAKWGKSRTITVWDFYNANKQAAQGIDGSADFALKLPQSIKVKTLNIDGVTLSVVGGRLHVDSTLTASGDLVAYGDEEGSSSAGGLDIARLWEALGGSMENKKISALYLPDLPKATASVLGGVKLRYDSVQTTAAQAATTTPARTYGVQVDSSGRLVVNVPWEDYSSADLIMWDYQTTLEGKIDAMDSAIAGKAASSHEHQLSEIKGFGNGWSSALTAAKPSWLTSVPKATDSAYGGFKTGYPEATGSRYYAVELNTLGQAYVHVPWTNTTYTLASFGITATAGEINKLDGVGTLLHSDNYTSYTYPTTVAKISDLHSSWDALLKAAPSAYVTRWPTAAEVGALTQSAADGRYAIQANDNNLISHGNEFNVIPAGFSNVVWFNFRAKGGTGSISQYVFGRGSAVAGEYAELLGSNFIADEGPGFVKRMHTDTSNFETGPVWDNAAGTSHLAAIGYWNTPQKVFINPCYNEVTDAWDDAVGKHNFVVGKNFLTYNTYPILHSGNIGSYALTPSNYTSTLDSRYMQDGANLGGKAYLRYVGINGGKYNFLTNVANSTDPFMVYAPTTAGASGQWLKSTGSTPVWANDGSGSGLDADLLDGTHKSGLLTALTSNATTNLSLTVGGTVKTVTDLYATYLEGQTLAGTRRGMSFLTSSFSAAGWYRVFTSANTNVVYSNEVILHIGRTYASPQNEHYTFSICVGYNGDISITQLSGVMGGHLITKIRVVWDNSQVFHIDIYSAASSYNNYYGVTGQGIGTFYAFTPNAAIPGGYTAYEFTTVDGCKSDRGFTTGGPGTFDTLKITGSTSAAHLAFGRTDNFNYISLPGASSTLAIAPGGDISGEGSALCISNSATYPGYSSGTRSLGTSSYRWSNIYSVAGNFSGAVTISSTLTLGAGITGVSTITGDGFAIGTNNLKIYDSTSKANRITANWSDGVARIYAINEAGTTYSDLCIGQTQTQASFLYYDASVARWGLGTKSPAYKLDVAGTLRATGRITAAGLTSSASIAANAGITTTTLSASGAVTLSSTLTAAGLVKASAGVQIGSTSDYGWYITNSRIVAGQSTARGVNVGSLLVSSAWADYTKVPTNGIYCKGNMQVARIGVGSSPNSNYAICTNGDAYLYNTIHTGDIHAQGDIDCNSLSATRLYVPSSEGNQKYYIRIE